MSTAPDNVEVLLSEIRNTILENKKFLLNLAEENDNEEVDREDMTVSNDQDVEDGFEEL